MHERGTESLAVVPGEGIAPARTTDMARVTERLRALPLQPGARSVLVDQTGGCKAEAGLDSVASIMAFFVDSYLHRHAIANAWSGGHLEPKLILSEEDGILTLMAMSSDVRSEPGGSAILVTADVCRTSLDGYFVVCDDVQEMDSILAIISGMRLDQ